MSGDIRNEIQILNSANGTDEKNSIARDEDLAGAGVFAQGLKNNMETNGKVIPA